MTLWMFDEVIVATITTLVTSYVWEALDKLLAQKRSRGNPFLFDDIAQFERVEKLLWDTYEALLEVELALSTLWNRIEHDINRDILSGSKLAFCEYYIRVGTDQPQDAILFLTETIKTHSNKAHESLTELLELSPNVTAAIAKRLNEIIYHPQLTRDMSRLAPFQTTRVASVEQCLGYVHKSKKFGVRTDEREPVNAIMTFYGSIELNYALHSAIRTILRDLSSKRKVRRRRHIVSLRHQSQEL